MDELTLCEPISSGAVSKYAQALDECVHQYLDTPLESVNHLDEEIEAVCNATHSVSGCTLPICTATHEKKHEFFNDQQLNTDSDSWQLNIISALKFTAVYNCKRAQRAS